MKPVYSVRLVLSGEDASKSVEAAWRSACEWLSRHPGGDSLPSAMLHEIDGTVPLGSGDVCTWSVLRGADTEVRRVQHDIAPSQRTATGWTTRVWVCREGDESWVVVRSGPQNPVGVVTAVRFDARRPGLVGTLVDELKVVADGIEVANTAFDAGKDDADWLLKLMFDPLRKLPVVGIAVVGEPDSSETLVSVDDLARDLAGVAHVVRVDPELSWALTREIGAPLGVHSGAVRVWWPRMSRDDDRFRHPLFLPDRIRENSARATRQLRGIIWNAAVDGIGPPALEAELLETKNREQVEARIEQIRTSRTSSDVDEWIAELENQIEENEVLRARLTEMTAETEDLRDALRQAEEGRDVFDDDDRQEVSTVEEAVHRAASEAENVVFLPGAYESARESAYPNPQQVLEDLRVIIKVAKKWRDGELRGGFKSAFKEEPVRYLEGVSKTAETRFRSDYEISVGGRSELMGPHLRRGVGSPNSILRIYWFVDNETRQLFVGHVGRKLRDVGNS